MTLTEPSQSPPDLNTTTEFLPSTSSQFPGAGDVLNLISKSNTKAYPVRESPARLTGRTMNTIPQNPSMTEESNFEDSSGVDGETDESTPFAANSVAVDMRGVEGREAQGDHVNPPLGTESGRHAERFLTRRPVLSNWLVLLWMYLFSNSIFYACYYESNVKQFIEQHPYVSLISVIVSISLGIALEFTLTLGNKNPLVWILNICLVVSVGFWTGSGVLIYDIKTALMAKCWVVTILLLFFALPKKNYKYPMVREAELVFGLAATIVIVLVAVTCHRKTSFVLIGVTGVSLALMSLSLVCEYCMKRDFKHVYKAFSLLEGVFYPMIALCLHLINSNE